MSQIRQRIFSRRFRLQEYLGILFTVLILVTGLAIAFTGYHVTSRTLISATDHWARSASGDVKRENINTIYRPAQEILAILRQDDLPQVDTLEKRLASLHVLQAILDLHPVIDALYTGYDTGEFFLVRSMRERTIRERHSAPDNSAILVESTTIHEGRTTSVYLFFDAELKLLQRRELEPRGYDPRIRDWYQKAKRQEGVSISGPYIFFSNRQVGITFAQKSRTGTAAIGVDIGLSLLSSLLTSETPTQDSAIALFRPDGTLIAFSDAMTVGDGTDKRLLGSEELPSILRLGIQMYKEGRTGHNISVNSDGRDWIFFFDEVNFSGKVQNIMLLAIPKDEVLADAVAFTRGALLITMCILIISLPFIWLTARGISRPLRLLVEKVARIRDFNLEENLPDSKISEISILSQGMRHMQDSLKKFLTITDAISAERNFSLLLERVLSETLKVATADGGMVILRDEKDNCLKDGSVCWVKGANGEDTVCRMADIRLQDTSLPPYQSMYTRVPISASVMRDDPFSRTDFLAPGFEDPEVTHVDTFCLPLCDRMGAVLGVLALFKAIKPGVATFQSQQCSFIKALSHSTAIALENQQLFKTQYDLRNALIHILANAIDFKSPYTGNHCQRVPVIFRMLAQAACTCTEGPLKEYSLNEDQWEEAMLAAWLHDCGKVTTPEYVVDKATKLETLYDRIHEIRTRFEVLKRDAEIASLRAVLNGADAEEERRKLEDALRALDDDFAFVAASNRGGEHVDEVALERLATISKRTWQRTLDKRLGISREELARMNRESTETLPVTEQVLMNRQEHIFERDEKNRIPTDNRYGFRMTTPDFLYNKGELYNLGIARGTLTEEERYKINDHIVQTLLMLEQLPLPKHLRNVPEIAGAHHETMDGKGYPRRVAREDMSWSARMMAIADIFEALTASDRPYKSGKTLSQALRIMDEFKANNHIDPDLYELFLKSGIPQRYAAKYLKPEQRDLAA